MKLPSRPDYKSAKTPEMLRIEQRHGLPIEHILATRYYGHGESCQDISWDLLVTPGTISAWLRYFHIDRNTMAWDEWRKRQHARAMEETA